jgi:hypothetical protein
VAEFLKMTPSQAAGLMAGGPTNDDLALWEDLRKSPEVEAIRARRAAERLTKRRELLAERKRERTALEKTCAEISRAKDEAARRLEAAEKAWKEALNAARALPFWTPDSNERLDRITRELRELEDPRIRALIEWIQHEEEYTLAFVGSPVLIDGAHLNSRTARDNHWDPDVREKVRLARQVEKDLEHRRHALRAALGKAEELNDEAFDDQALEAAFNRILAAIPPMPLGANQIGPTPRPLMLNGDAVSNNDPRQKTLSGITRQYEQLRVAAKAPGWWFRR